MITIIEGTDAVGKSSHAAWLAADQGARLLHASAPTNTCAHCEYVNPLLYAIRDGHRNIVCDRWHWGEMVWPKVFGRPSLFDVDGMLERVMTQLGQLPVRSLLVVREGTDIVRTLWERGEEDQIENVLLGQHLFLELALQYPMMLVPVESKDLPPFSLVTHGDMEDS